jgi:hypothetical protein
VSESRPGGRRSQEDGPFISNYFHPAAVTLTFPIGISAE